MLGVGWEESKGNICNKEESLGKDAPKRGSSLAGCRSPMDIERI